MHAPFAGGTLACTHVLHICGWSPGIQLQGVWLWRRQRATNTRPTPDQLYHPVHVPQGLGDSRMLHNAAEQAQQQHKQAALGLPTGRIRWVDMPTIVVQLGHKCPETQPVLARRQGARMCVDACRSQCWQVAGGTLACIREGLAVDTAGLLVLLQHLQAPKTVDAMRSACAALLTNTLVQLEC